MVIYWAMHWFWKLLIAVVIFLSIWFGIFLVYPKITPQEYVSNSSVHGLLVRNQVWEGTIRITGDLVTGPFTSITLKPGTKILVAIDGDKGNFDFLPWHSKNGINTGKDEKDVKQGEPFWNEKSKIQIHFGKLNALGTKEQPIIISSEAVPGSPYDFNVLSINKGVMSNIKFSNYRKFEIGRNVTIMSSVFNNTGECAVCITSGRPSVSGNIFSNNLREYIYISGASPQISDNIFEHSKGVGIRFNPKRRGTPLISYNNFEMPQALALDVLGGGENQGGAVILNKFSGGTIIQIPCDSKLKFLQNSILGTVSFITGSCIGSYTFGPNFWGSPDFKAIMSDRIILKENFKILIPVILKDPPNAGKRDQ